MTDSISSTSISDARKKRWKAINEYVYFDKCWYVDCTLRDVKDSTEVSCSNIACSLHILDYKGRYSKLPCGHVYHSHCIESHLYDKQRLDCCICGDLSSLIPYCDFCKEYGHYYGCQLHSPSERPDCFMSDLRSALIKDYKSGLSPKQISDNMHGFRSVKCVTRIIGVYKKLEKGESVDWRKELLPCDCKDPTHPWYSGRHGCEYC